MKTTEELLLPKYKVIATDTSFRFSVGDIIEVDGDCLFINGNYYPNFIALHDFPHLFKKLHWWEDIEKGELPKYVKTDGGGAWGLYKGVFKVLSYSQVNHERKENIDNLFISLEGNFDRTYRITVFLPATIEEYLTYKNKPL